MKLKLKLLKERLNLFMNSCLLLRRSYCRKLIDYKYHKLIVDINNKYHSQGNMISLKDMKAAIINTYYKKSFLKRGYLIDVIHNVMIVKNSYPIKSTKVQQRNEKCNCGSGKKFKNCCIKL